MVLETNARTLHSCIYHWVTIPDQNLLRVFWLLFLFSVFYLFICCPLDHSPVQNLKKNTIVSFAELQKSSLRAGAGKRCLKVEDTGLLWVRGLFTLGSVSVFYLLTSVISALFWGTNDIQVWIKVDEWLRMIFSAWFLNLNFLGNQMMVGVTHIFFVM